MTPDQIINELLKTIDNTIVDFNSSIPAIQKAAFSKVIELTKDLDLNKGRIKRTGKNIQVFRRIKKELENIILSKSYLKNVDKFILAWNAVDSANENYFAAINEKYTPGKIFEVLKTDMIDETIASLTESGISDKVTAPVQKILRQNISGGAMYQDMVEEMRNFLTDTKNGDGALASHAKQITTDSLNQYNANYNQIATSDLGLVWYKFVGSLIGTSREICIKMIEAKNDCMPYIHISQFNDLVNGYVCGKRVPIYKKTGLPYGMIEGTTAANYFIRRNGHGCGHQLYPVSSAIVPKSLRDKFEN